MPTNYFVRHPAVDGCPFGRDSEFPGDGIGLATVLRAVHRHGGLIWAHGAVNEGATFHFSLTPGAHPPVAAAPGEDVIPIWQPTDRHEDR